MMLNALVILTRTNGSKIVGSWVGKETWQNKPVIVIQMGGIKRNEWLDDIESVEVVQSVSVIFDRRLEIDELSN